MNDRYKRAEMPFNEVVKMLVEKGLVTKGEDLKNVRKKLESWRPDIEITHDVQAPDDPDFWIVVQFYHGNAPMWNEALFNAKQVLDAIKHNMGWITPKALVYDNEQPSGACVLVYDSALKKRGDDWNWEGQLQHLTINLCEGTVVRWTAIDANDAHKGTRLEQHRSLECFTLSVKALTTLARWRWPEIQVFSFYVHGDERLTEEQPDKFDLELR